MCDRTRTSIHTPYESQTCDASQPKIYNLSLLVFLSSDFLLIENRSSCFFSFRICGKTCSCGSFCFFPFDCSFACCTTKNYFLVFPQKLRSSWKMNSIMLRKTHLNVSKIMAQFTLEDEQIVSTNKSSDDLFV